MGAQRGQEAGCRTRLRAASGSDVDAADDETRLDQGRCHAVTGASARLPGDSLTDSRAARSLRASARGDRIFQILITTFALAIPALLVVIAISILLAAWPALSTAGFSFLTGSTWDVSRGEFGAAPAIYGTVVSSILALLLATPLALGVSIFLSEIAPPWVRQPIGFLVDLVAAIPSVVYGLWGIFVLIPVLRDPVGPFLSETLGLGRTPLFSGPNYGYSMFSAGVILAIMILPFIAVVTREVLLAVPRSQREAALALGATRWEMIRDAVLPYARSGIIGGIILGLGRALGETMAVTMLIGNVAQVKGSLLADRKSGV